MGCFQARPLTSPAQSPLTLSIFTQQRTFRVWGWVELLIALIMVLKKRENALHCMQEARVPEELHGAEGPPHFPPLILPNPLGTVTEQETELGGDT